MLNKKLLEEIAVRLQFALVKELLDQGHKATGRLYKSVKVAVLERVNEWILEGSFNGRYGNYLDTGIRANRWRRSASRAHVDAIIRWIKVKSIRPRRGTVENFAWAIVKSRPKIGYPSPNSRRFSRNGRITKWQTYTLKKEESKIEKQISEASEIGIALVLDDLINKIEREYGS